MMQDEDSVDNEIDGKVAIVRKTVELEADENTIGIFLKSDTCLSIDRNP